MESYSVKQFCNMVGVPYSSLRYYERINLLSPKQDENNLYRAYTPHDAFRVNRFKIFRALGFGINEALTFIENTDKEYTMEKIEEREKVIKEQFIMLQEQCRCIERIKEKMRISMKEEHFEIVEEKDKWFLPASRGYDFRVASYEVFSKWVELLPTTVYSKIIEKDNFLSTEGEYRMDYGIAIDVESDYMLEKTLLEEAKKVTLGKCVVFYTTKIVYKQINREVFYNLFDFLNAGGLEIDGDVYIEGINVNEENAKKGNIVWIPVKSKTY